MIELEPMQRAKMYLDKLAQGIDPITNQEVPETLCWTICPIPWRRKKLPKTKEVRKWQAMN